MRFVSRIWLALALALPAAATAQSAATHIAPALVAETQTPAPGSQVMLAFVMKPGAQWHGYWQNPGDAGLPTQVKWTAPKGLSFGTLQYPVPQPLLIAGLMNHVYERDFALLVTARIPTEAAPGTKLPITARLDWLACNPSTCVPESATLSIMLTVGDGAVVPDARARFDEWRAALPRPLGAPAHYQVVNGRFRLELPLPASVDASKAYFFAATDNAVDYAAPQTVTRDGGRLVIETAAKPSPPARVDGLVRLAPNSGLRFTATPGKVAPASPTPRKAGVGVAWVVAGVIVGGVLGAMAYRQFRRG